MQWYPQSEVVLLYVLLELCLNLSLVSLIFYSIFCIASTYIFSTVGIGFNDNGSKTLS